jgi:K+-transporting ATPase ATPase B chain
VSTRTASALFDPTIARRAARDAFVKLDPRRMVKNPVMFVVEVGSLFTTVLAVHAAVTGQGEAPVGFIAAISVWLWFTVLFSNFAEAMAEGRGKAQADTLRLARSDVPAKKLAHAHREAPVTLVPSSQLRKGDVVLVEAGDFLPGDGEVVEGVASVNESAITGESAPVIRESGGDRSAVTGGTRVLSDWLLVRISTEPGQSFLDRMISMVEGAKRQKTPNEIALDILLAALSLIFLLATVTLLPFSRDAVAAAGQGQPVSLTVLVALLVCLIPTTIGGLLSAIGIAGMDRMIQANVLATSGRAVEAAGDVDVLMLDKIGTITLGNRQATRFLPAPEVSDLQLADAARLSSLADETPEGRSIVALARQRSDLRALDEASVAATATFVAFTAQTRMSGVDLAGRQIRKGAADAVFRFVTQAGGQVAQTVRDQVEQVARAGSTPLVVCDGARVLGVVELKDIVKGGIRERFAQLRALGIRTVMVTGDNPLTAAAIAAEAGVDDFIAEATPEMKLARIRALQAEGHLVAMTGDGTNDAPALAQADVAVAMNTGTQAAKEAGNMVDLDSNPTKLLAIVDIGKQMLMTRGALTTFSIANDVSKYFAIIPAAFASTYPQLRVLDVMRLHSPSSAVLSAVIFNALIIVALIPIALRGLTVRAALAAVVLRRNVLVFGLGGLVLPFPFIKLIDVLLAAAHLAGRSPMPHLRPALFFLVVFTLLTGGAYPAAVTGLAQLAFSREANGSVLSQKGAPVGSRLIGQDCHRDGHFWSRPSATAQAPYDARASVGSNLGPSNPALTDAVTERLRQYGGHAPMDLVTSSASGLDPHISPEAAQAQVARVAAARHLELAQLERLVAAHTEGPTFGVLGEPRVNVLELNLALDSQ